MRVLVATLFGFAASLALGLATTACSSKDPCDCGPVPAQPVEASVPLESARRYTDGGNTVIAPLNFSEGSITTEGATLTVRYTNPDGEYVVTYEREQR